MTRYFSTRATATAFEITERPKAWELGGETAGYTAVAWKAAILQAAEQDKTVVYTALSGRSADLGVLFDAERFEHAVYSGHVGYGLSMTDGHYAPEPFAAWVEAFRRNPEHHLAVDNDVPPYVKASLPAYLATR